MPQMAPYNWLILNFIFSMIFIIYLTLLYYNKNYNIKIISKKLINSNFKPTW